MAKPLAAKTIEIRLAQIGYRTPQAIAAGLGIQNCLCGLSGGDIIRSAMRPHGGGTPHLWQLLAAAVWAQHLRKYQDRSLASEDQVLQLLADQPGLTGNAIVRALRKNRNETYNILSNLADSGHIMFRKHGVGKCWSLTELGATEAKANTKTAARADTRELVEVLDEGPPKEPRAAAAVPTGDNTITDILGNVVDLKSRPALPPDPPAEEPGEGGMGLPDSALFDEDEGETAEL